MKISENKNKMVKKIAGVALISVIVTVLYFYFRDFNVETVKDFVAGFGVIAPLVFILVVAFKPVLFFIPAMGLTVVAGTLFGPFYGTLYVALGGAGSTIVAFLLARKFGRERALRFIKKSERLLKLDESMENNGFRTILFLRAINIPWDIVSYSAGFSSIRFIEFYLASLILLLPISFVYTYFGSSIWEPGSQNFIISLSLIIIFGTMPFVINKVKKIKYAGVK
ncbi:hypothetical protein MNBD_DELTA01-629 [hydrothermal vent metagenome]|uniref:VTT domain-containing protein n=1 Tax=hydrothermal vent metagenome TaxID=652676 RepID=A0A3B0RMA4_9ZZZZ